MKLSQIMILSYTFLASLLRNNAYFRLFSHKLRVGTFGWNFSFPLLSSSLSVFSSHYWLFSLLSPILVSTLTLLASLLRNQFIFTVSYGLELLVGTFPFLSWASHSRFLVHIIGYFRSSFRFWYLISLFLLHCCAINSFSLFHLFNTGWNFLFHFILWDNISERTYRKEQ